MSAAKVLLESARASRPPTTRRMRAYKVPELEKKKPGRADAKAIDKMVAYVQKMLARGEAQRRAAREHGGGRAGLRSRLGSRRRRRGLGEVKAALVAMGHGRRRGPGRGNTRAWPGPPPPTTPRRWPRASGDLRRGAGRREKAGIETERSPWPVTEAMPKLKGAPLRGWPAGRYLSSVPGVNSGLGEEVVVGTMEKDGKRDAPGEGEGRSCTARPTSTAMRPATFHAPMQEEQQRTLSLNRTPGNRFPPATLMHVGAAFSYSSPCRRLCQRRWLDLGNLRRELRDGRPPATAAARAGGVWPANPWPVRGPPPASRFNGALHGPAPVVLPTP